MSANKIKESGGGNAKSGFFEVCGGACASRRVGDIRGGGVSCPVFEAMDLIGSFSVLVGISLYCVMKACTGIHGPGVSTFPFESVARVVKPGRENSGV